MEILIYRWRSYNQKSVEEAFLNLGHSIYIITEKITNIETDPDYVYKTVIKLRQNHYDMLFSVNFFPVLAEACYETDTPYVCWNCDSPLLAMYNNAVFYKTNFIFTFDYSNYEEFKNLGAGHIYYLPLATGVINYTPATGFSYKYDVSFVGRLYEKNSFDSIAPGLPAYLCGYFDAALSAQLHVSGGNLLEKLLTPDICMLLEEITDYQRSEASFASIQTLFSTTVLGFKAAAMQRLSCLNKLSMLLNRTQVNGRKCFLHLFTDSPTDALPLVKCHKAAGYQEEMPFIFSQSLINLNFTIPNIKAGIPLRVWDILSCGGFLMTDYRTGLLDYFEPGKDIVIFEDYNELTEKALFYLEHENTRNKIAYNAYKKVSQEHTTKNRIKNILDIVLEEI